MVPLLVRRNNLAAVECAKGNDARGDSMKIINLCNKNIAQCDDSSDCANLSKYTNTPKS